MDREANVDAKLRQPNPAQQPPLSARSLPSLPQVLAQNHHQNSQRYQHQGAGAQATMLASPVEASSDASRAHIGKTPEPSVKQQQPLVAAQPTLDSRMIAQRPRLQSPKPESLHREQDKESSTSGKYSLRDFDILRTLGTGSFGRVHLVRSVHNQRYYAIKVLKKAQVVKMKQVHHTNDERRMLQKVRFPFLIRLWGTFQDSSNLFMVIDYVEGGELFSLLRKSRRFPNAVAKFYAAEVILAIEYLHSHNIIYRDLKPENVLLDRNGHIKLTDLGFAKEVTDVTWTLCGTPDYIAPEVIASKPYNKSVDWWSLGILIFEMLAGYAPFYSQTHMRTYEKILMGNVTYPSYIRPTALDLLRRLITADLSMRLGNLRNGAADVKRHPWFDDVLWDRLLNRDIETPYEPPIQSGCGDTSQYDRYPEVELSHGKDGPDPYRQYFIGF